MRIGLGMYDALAGRRGIGATRWLSSAATQGRLPGVRGEGLQGGVAYWDGQFDDARLAIALMRTAIGLGATVLNYVRVEQIATRGRTRAARRRGRRRVRRTLRTAGKGGVQRRGRLGRCGPEAGGRQRVATHHGQPWFAHRARPPFHAGRVRPDDPEDPRWPRAVRHPVARPPDRRYHRRAGGRAGVGSEALRKRDRVHSRDSARILVDAAYTSRRPVRLRRAAAAVFAGRARRHQDDFERARDRHRAWQPADGDRRQVDDLPPDGARRAGAGGATRAARRAAMHHRTPASGHRSEAWRLRIGRRRLRQRTAMRRVCRRTCTWRSNGSRRAAPKTSWHAGCASDCCRTA